MLFKDIAVLIKSCQEYDDAGDIKEQEISREIFCNKKSVRQSEFYQAQAVGLRPEIMLEIRYDEYSDEKKVKYENVTYEVIRTYSKNNEILELTLGGGINATT